jgi:hypothetical protein
MLVISLLGRDAITTMNHSGAIDSRTATISAT